MKNRLRVSHTPGPCRITPRHEIVLQVRSWDDRTSASYTGCTMLMAWSQTRIHLCLAYGHAAWAVLCWASLLSGMAPPVSHAPKQSCRNYPLCKSNSYLDKNAGKWLQYCGKCLKNPDCLQEGCSHHAAPGGKGWSAHGLFSDHVRDPCHAGPRQWNLCKHKEFGCHYLSENRLRGKCFACDAGSPPCANAYLGCAQHVRQSSIKNRKACTPHDNKLCPFDHNRVDTVCAKRCCSQPRHGNNLCQSCFQGKFPCADLCGRRTSSDNQENVCSASPQLLLPGRRPRVKLPLRVWEHP